MYSPTRWKSKSSSNLGFTFPSGDDSSLPDLPCVTDFTPQRLTSARDPRRSNDSGLRGRNFCRELRTKFFLEKFEAWTDDTLAENYGFTTV